jgi:hypothetical protein
VSSAISPPKDHPQHLLVEGRDDVMTIGSLLARCGVAWPGDDWHPYINAVGNDVEVLKTVPLALRASYRRLGVVVDADLSLTNRWAQAIAAFGHGGVRLPATPSQGGTIVDRVASTGPSRVGVWLMPDNSASGMLEDFVARLVPHGDPVWPIATESTSTAISAGAPLPPAHSSKGSIHAYLAWQDPSGMPFGTALTARILRHDAAIAQTFLKWLRDLFAD